MCIVFSICSTRPRRSDTLTFFLLQKPSAKDAKGENLLDGAYVKAPLEKMVPQGLFEWLRVINVQ